MPVTVAVKPAEADKGSVVLSNNTHKSWWRDAGLRLLAWHSFVLLLGSYVCGYDGSVMNGFFGISVFLEDVGQPDANLQGLYTAAISIGYLIGFIPSAFLGDKYGRKWPQFGGAAVVCIGVLMQTFAISGWKFFGARILIGFGASFPLTLGSTHLFELAHPRQAVQMVAFFAAFYWVGAIVSSWLTYGAVNITSNWSWRFPALFQGLASLIQVLAIYWVPESPRWLMANGRAEEAHAILAKYHANGSMNDELVLSEVAQINTALEIERASPAFGYLDFFKTKANRFRLFMCIWIGVIVQWVGNGILSYYLIPVLASVNITSVPQQQGLNGGLQIWNLAASVTGVIFCQSVPRRTMWLFSTVGILVTYVAFTVCSAIFDKNGSAAAGRGAVAMIYLYSGFYDVAYSIFYYSYVLEILPYNMRTKGMAISLFFDYAALFFNQYVNPVAFTGIGYRYYYVYIGTIFISLLVVWFLFPEVGNMTLEQSAALLDQGATAKITKAGVDNALGADEKNLVKEETTRSAE